MRLFLFSLDKFLKRKAPINGLSKILNFLNEKSSIPIWQPGYHSFKALDPWFCVSAFQRICPFTK